MRCASFSLLVFLATFIVFGGCKPQGPYWAKYTDKSFAGGHDRFSEVYTGGRSLGYKIAPIYLRFPDGNSVKLSDLAEETVRNWVSKKEPEALRELSMGKYTDPGGVTLMSYDVDGNCKFTFHEGKLAGCVVTGLLTESPLAGVQVGPSADGEFLSFPISREDLVRVFGKPDKFVQGAPVGR